MNPYRKQVRADIDIYAALEAIEYFAANYPAERLDLHDAGRLLRASRLITQRATVYRLNIILPPGSTVAQPEMIKAPLPAGVPDTPNVRECLETLVADGIPLSIKYTAEVHTVSDATGCSEIDASSQELFGAEKTR